MRRVGRPSVGDEPRKLITIRLGAKVLGGLRKRAKKKGLPYQSLVNEILAGRDAEGKLETGRDPTFMWRKDGWCSI